MKSSYNPREEIEELRALVIHLTNAMNGAEQQIRDLEAKVISFERKTAELAKMVDRLNMETKATRTEATKTRGTLGSTNRTVSDINGYLQRKFGK